MVSNELVNSGVEAMEPMVANEFVSQYRGDAMTDGFKVFRMVRSDRGVERGPRKPVKAVRVSKAKRGPGRPRVYNGSQRRQVAAALKRHGLTKGIEFLAAERKLNVSITLARDVAEEFGIEFKRGRPAA